MLKIWGRRNSLNVQKVMWLIGELGLEHEHIPAGGSFGGLTDPAFLARNPNALVPVIEDEGVTIWESHAIIRYLAARHGSQAWWPASAADRSVADQWIEWAQSTWQPAYSGIFWGWYRTPAPLRDEAAIAASHRRSVELLAIAERVLKDHAHLAGEAFSLGDIPFGASLYRYFTLEISRPSLPRVEAYYARLTERPAYREHVMVAYDELKGRLAF